MSNQEPVPRSVEEFQTLIRNRYETLSAKLQQIARHVLECPDDLAFETLTVTAERAHVPPSAIVRFAKTLGFSGAHPMRRTVRKACFFPGRGRWLRR